MMEKERKRQTRLKQQRKEMKEREDRMDHELFGTPHPKPYNERSKLSKVRDR